MRAYLVIAAADPVPDENNVVAGWTAFALFGLGLVAIALIGYFLVRSLRRAQQSAVEGRYDPSDPKPQRPPRAR